MQFISLLFARESNIYVLDAAWKDYVCSLHSCSEFIKKMHLPWENKVTWACVVPQLTGICRERVNFFSYIIISLRWKCCDLVRFPHDRVIWLRFYAFAIKKKYSYVIFEPFCAVSSRSISRLALYIKRARRVNLEISYIHFAHARYVHNSWKFNTLPFLQSNE